MVFLLVFLNEKCDLQRVDKKNRPKKKNDLHVSE